MVQVSGFGFRVSGFGFRVSGFGFKLFYFFLLLTFSFAFRTSSFILPICFLEFEISLRPRPYIPIGNVVHVPADPEGWELTTDRFGGVSPVWVRMTS